jgi:SAM-dependent methyltransferase
MSDYDETTYGEGIAEVYDDWHKSVYDESATVAALKELAGAGPALELGVGTGRLALPLAALGIEVHGIDASPAMVAKLRAKPGGARLPVTVGNFAEVAVEGHYALVFIAFNTFFALTSQEEQVRCFANVAAHLTAAGVFVIEAFVPDPARFTRGQIVQVSRVETDRVILETSQHDPVAQRSLAQHVVITEAGIQLYPVQVRYAWPAELDLMARLAGLRLRARWGGWRREPFTAASNNHVSIYGLIPPGAE